MYTDEWCPTVSTVGLPSKKVQVLSHSHAQNEAQIDQAPENGIKYFGGCLGCNMYQVTALGWLKKEEDEQI